MSKQHSNSVQKQMVNRYEKGESATQIAESLRLFTTAVTRILKRNGVEIRSQKGREHSGWKGGRGVKAGYWTVFIEKHPRRMAIGRVFEHILVAEKKYGRFIKKGEPIHHIDFDRLNNDPENLYLCKNHQEHMNIHYSLEEIARELFRSNKLGFRDGKYYWK